MKLFYYDLETTGLNHWEHGIHQISGLIEIDGKLVDKINLHVQPYDKAKIDDKSLEMNGVTRKGLKDYYPFKDGYKILTYTLSKYVNKFDPKDKFHLVGYNNGGFDNAFFRAFFVQNGDKYFNSWFWIDYLDVMVLASNMFKEERHKFTDFKLSTVCKRLGIKFENDKLHDALYDIGLTREIYKKIQKHG